VKHAIKTVISILEMRDRLTLVAFSSNAHVVYPLTSMTDENKVSVTAALEMLTDGGSTNLWDGLKTGLDQLKDTSGLNSSVMLFTDGMPNVEPPRGYLGSLRD